MNIELRPVDQIAPYPKNPRKIPDAAVNAVARSITEFGFRQPVVVDRDGVIIVGHVRWRAPEHCPACGRKLVFRLEFDDRG